MRRRARSSSGCARCRDTAETKTETSSMRMRGPLTVARPSDPERDAPACPREQTPREDPEDDAVERRAQPDGARPGSAPSNGARTISSRSKKGLSGNSAWPLPSWSGFQITGLMKKAICITLATIGRMSRNRAQNVPNSRTKRQRVDTPQQQPRKRQQPVPTGPDPEHHVDHHDHQDIMREHEDIADQHADREQEERHPHRADDPLGSVNAVQDSATTVARNPHSTIDRARNGR